MTHEEAQRASERADKLYRAIRRCGDTEAGRRRAERLARAWVRTVDLILDYKRSRFAQEARRK